MSVLPQPVGGPAIAAAVALAAWRAGSLSAGGAIAATVVGSVAAMAGWPWGAFLVGWFVTASVASRAGRAVKEAATGDVVAKGGRRDHWQVLANGGVFALCALLAMLSPAWAPQAAVAGASALVAAGADTLATETGTWWGGRPWSLRTFAPAAVGTSGAVSAAGTAGMVVAALLLAQMARAVDMIGAGEVAVVAAAGVGGALADTLIGAWWQARRWCPSCHKETEQNRHRCGTVTRRTGGMAWLGNDGVNFLCTAVGAAAGTAMLTVPR